MIIKITVLLFLLAIVVMILARKKPYHKGIDWFDLRRFFKVLLEDCTDGSLLIIEHESSKRFIQFVKYSSANSNLILHFAFPDAPWSRKYFKQLEASFYEEGYNLRQERTNSESVTQFIEIDLSGKGPELVVQGEKLAHIALKALGLGEDSIFKIHFEGKLKQKGVSVKK